MRRLSAVRPVLIALGVVLADHAPAAAGMPAPFRVTDAGSLRLQTLSFFLAVFLASALVVRWVWNALRADFPRLPRLSYPKAVGLVGLWGLLFLLVLTMISGARELMTPGAWRQDGATYTLASAPPPPTDPHPSGPTETQRREKLLRLYGAITAYAAQHKGDDPPADAPELPVEVWQTPHPSGMRYVYRRGTRTDGDRVLACEPELFGDGRLALFTTGTVKRLTSAELAPLLAEGAK